MPISKILFTVPLIAASLTLSAAAQPDHDNNSRGNAYAYGRSKSGPATSPTTRGAPGPVAGTGLVGFGVAGAVIYLLYRRRRQTKQD